jgi:hypothetical protein
MAVPGALPHMKSGRGKVIGISTAKKSPLDASWATPRDAGIPDLDASIWVGLFAPKGTPQPVIDRLNKEVRATLNAPEVQKKFVESAGAEAVGMTPAEFLARIKSDAVRYKRVVRQGGHQAGLAGLPPEGRPRQLHGLRCPGCCSRASRARARAGEKPRRLDVQPVPRSRFEV